MKLCKMCENIQDRKMLAFKMKIAIVLFQKYVIFISFSEHPLNAMIQKSSGTA